MNYSEKGRMVQGVHKSKDSREEPSGEDAMVWKIHCNDNGRRELFKMEARWCERSIRAGTVARNCPGWVRDGVENLLRQGWSQWTIQTGSETVR